MRVTAAAQQHNSQEVNHLGCTRLPALSEPTVDRLAVAWNLIQRHRDVNLIIKQSGQREAPLMVGLAPGGPFLLALAASLQEAPIHWHLNMKQGPPVHLKLEVYRPVQVVG